MNNILIAVFVSLAFAGTASAQCLSVGDVDIAYEGQAPGQFIPDDVKVTPTPYLVPAGEVWDISRVSFSVKGDSAPYANYANPDAGKWTPLEYAIVVFRPVTQQSGIYGLNMMSVYDRVVRSWFPLVGGRTFAAGELLLEPGWGLAVRVGTPFSVGPSGAKEVGVVKAYGKRYPVACTQGVRMGR